MLAQSFQSAADLKITEPQRAALMKTLVLMETGKLKHAPIGDGWYSERGEFTGAFNMHQWNAAVHGCGTVACIGGTAELVGGVDLHTDLDYRTPLYMLFHPDLPEDDWNAITPAQAAKALRSYLTIGDAKWHEAVA